MFLRVCGRIMVDPESTAHLIRMASIILWRIISDNAAASPLCTFHQASGGKNEFRLLIQLIIHAQLNDLYFSSFESPIKPFIRQLNGDYHTEVMSI